jgi:hypothetical protein
MKNLNPREERLSDETFLQDKRKRIVRKEHN